MATEAREKTVSSGMVWYTTVVAAMGAFLDGYDLAIIGGALVFLVPQWHLGAGQTGILGSLAFAGMIIGALIFGRMTDRIGRKSAFVLDLALFVIGGLLSALATGLPMMLIGRFLVGLGIGADLPISTALIAEISPSHRRGFLTGLMQVFWFGGAMVSAVVAIALAVHGSPESWRWMLGSAVVVAAVVMVLRTRIVESPRWLRAQEEARRTRSVSSDSVSVAARVGSVHALLSPQYRSSLFLVSLFWFLVTIRGAAFVVYTPTVLARFGMTSKIGPFEMNVVLFGVYTLVSYISALYIDKVGRRTIILIGWALATAVTLWMAFVSSSDPMMLFVVLLLSTVPIQTVTVAIFPWSVEFFPTKLRGTAQSVASASGKLGGLLAALLFPVILAAVGWQTTVLLFFALMAVGLLMGLMIKPVETRNKTLEDIVDLAPQSQSGGPVHEIAHH